MNASGVEAVGKGTVTAQMNSASVPDCQISLILNGSAGNSVEVEDGDSVSVEIQAVGKCACCETKRDCTGGSQSSGMWLKKSGREGGVVAMDKSALEQKIKFVIERVRKRKRGLRRNN